MRLFADDTRNALFTVSGEMTRALKVHLSHQALAVGFASSTRQNLDPRLAPLVHHGVKTSNCNLRTTREQFEGMRATFPLARIDVRTHLRETPVNRKVVAEAGSFGSSTSDWAGTSCVIFNAVGGQRGF
jgi:hypothetical protein